MQRKAPSNRNELTNTWKTVSTLIKNLQELNI